MMLDIDEFSIRCYSLQQGKQSLLNSWIEYVNGWLSMLHSLTAAEFDEAGR